MAKVGRPTGYSIELAREICVRLAHGEPLVRMCKEEKMPTVSSVYVWLTQHKEFADMYAKAREDQADTLADEIIAIADESQNDSYVDDNGKVKTDWEVVGRSKLRVDARKWVAAKLKPRKYGDRVDHAIEANMTVTLAETDKAL